MCSSYVRAVQAGHAHTTFVAILNLPFALPLSPPPPHPAPAARVASLTSALRTWSTNGSADLGLEESASRRRPTDTLVALSLRE
jgi:hypothetical protein